MTQDQEIKAYMESLGFKRVDEHGTGALIPGWRHKDRELDDEQALIFYNAHIASTRKTLEKLRQDVVGEDERGLFKDVEGSIVCEIHGGSADCVCDARNELREEQRQKLDQMISALERKGDDV
jgi:hypothetical protein